MNLEKAICKASLKLREQNIKSYKLDCEILMAKIIGKTREFVIVNSNQKLKDTNLIDFEKLVEKRLKGEPIAYLIGKKSFWKYEFEINKKTLIPRPDTELIIEQTLKIFSKKININFLDIGVGSGCIILSILKEKKNFFGTGIDISKECIKITQMNANKFRVNNRIKLFKTDVDNFNLGKYDLIISNPPYIKKLDLKYLEKDVVCFEPKIALNGGLAGISEIRKVIMKSSELIKKKGKLILEIAFDQKYEVKKLLKENGFYINSIVKDLANKDRCIVSTKI
jgi:release factor glutamine methyltransferase